jgi:predicted  nucleic acid-binding Zn-ribbon protein
MFKFEPLRRVFVLAWLSLSLAECSSADPCTELDGAIDVLIPAVRNSGKQIDQASDAQKVADAINAYADAAEKLATTIQRLRPQLEKLSADEPEACQAANRRLEAFQPEINAVIEKLDYKQRRYSADPSVTNAWRRLIKITEG